GARGAGRAHAAALERRRGRGIRRRTPGRAGPCLRDAGKGERRPGAARAGGRGLGGLRFLEQRELLARELEAAPHVGELLGVEAPREAGEEVLVLVLDVACHEVAGDVQPRAPLVRAGTQAREL